MSRLTREQLLAAVILSKVLPSPGDCCQRCSAANKTCSFLSWGRACVACEGHYYADCKYKSLDEWNSFRHSPHFQLPEPALLDSVPPAFLFPHVPEVFAILTWLMQHENDPYFHPDVEHLALKVLIERGHPDSLNALFAIRQSGTLTFTATARPVRTP
ncbi:hypothetical protein FB45DRAFT_1041100 [Roridomyces roridus]|uniref:Uncharacterized protein n=1 Tax=Roridomyces roridus TaxID=1738132 RepID=A0AAD7B0D4_9AGAR|nr:hypothetical protein FB45DRAFT_1041100 [Roridomyces roridus]